MPRICVIVPFPFDEHGLAKRRAQKRSITLGPGTQLDYRPVKAGAAFADSYHDYVLFDLAMLDAGLDAAADGYDALCIDTMSDSGVDALRSLVDIPVIGPARACYLTALMLGSSFSVLTQWDPWIPMYKKGVQQLGLAGHLASVRSIDVAPDPENLLGGKEEEIFPLLRDAGISCIRDGADAIILGSTTMHEAHGYLSEQLPVPVLNPGPVSYKIAETMLGLGLAHSRTAYPAPHVPKIEMIHAMADAARDSETRRNPRSLPPTRYQHPQAAGGVPSSKKV